MKLNHIELPTVEDIATERGLVHHFWRVANAQIISYTIERPWLQHRLLPYKSCQEMMTEARRLFTMFLQRTIFGSLAMAAALFWQCMIFSAGVIHAEARPFNWLLQVMGMAVFFLTGGLLFVDGRVFRKKGLILQKHVRAFLNDWLQYHKLLDKQATIYSGDYDLIMNILENLERKRRSILQKQRREWEKDQTMTSRTLELDREHDMVRDELSEACNVFSRFGHKDADYTIIECRVSFQDEHKQLA